MNGSKDKVHYDIEEKQKKGKPKIGVMMFYNQNYFSVSGSMIRIYDSRKIILNF